MTAASRFTTRRGNTALFFQRRDQLEFMPSQGDFSGLPSPSFVGDSFCCAEQGAAGARPMFQRPQALQCVPPSTLALTISSGVAVR